MMRDYFFKMFILHIVASAVCSPYKRKGLRSTILDNWEKQAEYEYCHKNMFATAEEYATWPELTNEIQAELCKKYINKLFDMKKKSVVSTLCIFIQIYYAELEKKNKEIFEGVSVASLMCEISPPAEGRKFLFFIRSPKNECLYLVQHRVSSSKEFRIITEICELGEYNYWRFTQARRDTKRPKKLKIWKMKSDNEDDIQTYENNHLQDYALHKDYYVKWPDFREKSADEFCKTLLKKMFPKTKNLTINATDEKLELCYVKIQRNQELSPNVTVSSLKCHIPEKKYHLNCFRFIKAPIQKCVHMVKQTNSTIFKFYIAKLFCEDDDASETGDVGLEKNERQNILKDEFYKIRKTSQYGETKIGYDEHEEK